VAGYSVAPVRGDCLAAVRAGGRVQDGWPAARARADLLPPDAHSELVRYPADSPAAWMRVDPVA